MQVILDRPQNIIDHVMSSSNIVCEANEPAWLALLEAAIVEDYPLYELIRWKSVHIDNTVIQLPKKGNREFYGVRSGLVCDPLGNIYIARVVNGDLIVHRQSRLTPMFVEVFAAIGLEIPIVPWQEIPSEFCCNTNGELTDTQQLRSQYDQGLATYNDSLDSLKFFLKLIVIISFQKDSPIGLSEAEYIISSWLSFYSQAIADGITGARELYTIACEEIVCFAFRFDLFHDGPRAGCRLLTSFYQQHKHEYSDHQWNYMLMLPLSKIDSGIERSLAIQMLHNSQLPPALVNTVISAAH